MWDLEFWVRLVSVVVGTVCFSVIFYVRPKHLPLAALGSAITFVAYSLIIYLEMSLFAAGFISTVAAALFAEVCARVCRAPALVFLIPCLLPTVPGGDLYHAMSNFLAKNSTLGYEYLMSALKISIGIAGGIVTVSLAVTLFYNLKKRRIGAPKHDL